MMTKMIAPIALALVLGALPAGAASRHHERGNGKVEQLAYRLESAAGELYRDAARHARQRGWREWQALHALQRLDQRADRFLEQVVRHGIHHPRTTHDFEQLERAFVRAEARRSDLRRARRLRDEFERVEQLMGKLDRRLVNRSDDERPRRHAVVRPEARHSWVSFWLSR
ncbi:MAG: hypothetical protein JRS35_01790 [Deltaproteobacteria bacterium]|nr:hypothetical protein [Deltaproteobacteria bacterium]